MSKQEMPGIERSDSFNTYAQKELLCVRWRSLWTGQRRRRKPGKDEKIGRGRFLKTQFRLTIRYEILRQNKGSPPRSSGRASLLLEETNGGRESRLHRYGEHPLHHRRESRLHRYGEHPLHHRREGYHRRRNPGLAHYWNARGPDSCG
jgi:hypothetical protein